MVLNAAGDSVKVVLNSDTCADVPAAGTSIITDLGPDDSIGAINATVNFIFTQAGMYKVCYKVERGTFVQVGGTSWVVSGVVPTHFQGGSNMIVKEDEFITLNGGSGMNLGSGKDKCKLIDWHDPCSSAAVPASNSVEVTPWVARD